MMRRGIIVQVLAGFLLTGCARHEEQPRFTSQEYGPHTSLLTLIADPASWHGKDVYCLGFANIEFEGNAIFLHETDCRHRLHKNALWIDIPPEIETNAGHYHHKYVWLRGTFDAHMIGHGGMYSGGIGNIRGIGVHSEPDGSVPVESHNLFLKEQ